MDLDGRTIIEKRFITLGDPDIVDTEVQIQPNGVDLRVNKIYEVQGRAKIPTDGKVVHNFKFKEIVAKDNVFELRPEKSVLFYVDFLEEISVPGGWCATLITRSSLVRSGVDVMSGLWDSGFQGTLGCSLRLQAPVDIEWGARICQVRFHDAKFNGHLYDGRYQNTSSQSAIRS